jgi:sirohydrochlorin cobaltochelatase
LSSAYLLVSHGSRDPRSQIAVDRLAQQLSLSLGQLSSTTSPARIATAQLELADKPLHLQIIDFADNCSEWGIDSPSLRDAARTERRCQRVVILPLFLSPGVHVMEDIPAEVELAEQMLKTRQQPEIDRRLKLILTPFVSTYADFANLFGESRSHLPHSTIILAHGSRRKGGNIMAEQLAASLKAEIAYWSIEPSLVDRVATLVATGATDIGILPYFLFVGGITDAIAELVSKLRQQFPQVRLTLAEPIGNSPDFVQTIGKILRSIEIYPLSTADRNI